MNWDDGLTEEQKRAASYYGSHSCLIAGPGTGKTLTLTRRILFLITECNVDPKNILALTFTRASTAVLKKEIKEQLDLIDLPLPRISTLHSFSLRQIIRNKNVIDILPQPLRIADSWEEKNIIQEDLKTMTKMNKRTIKDRFNQLSAGWETLEVEDETWEKLFPDPKFLGAWRLHRETYGFTLRAELVYQLKRALEQLNDFTIESDYDYLLIDEYQDLNKCDLAVLDKITQNGAELYASGDDDQSIYGFRYAHPDGIRHFEKDYPNSCKFYLTTCYRCDKEILKLGLFVANLDIDRLPKSLQPRQNANKGETHLIRFIGEQQEAIGISRICKDLMRVYNYEPKDIMVLLRMDPNGVYSNLIKKYLVKNKIPVEINAEETLPINTPEGRKFISLLRFSLNDLDNLSLRTIFQVTENNQIGSMSFTKINEIARDKNITFVEAVNDIISNPKSYPRLGKIIVKEFDNLRKMIMNCRERLPLKTSSIDVDEFIDRMITLTDEYIDDIEKRITITDYLSKVAKENNSTTVSDLLSNIFSSVDNIEQELSDDNINVLTMHRAKGLTAKAVIIAGAENELIPGNNLGIKIGDERRLFYVSLTRAKHNLYITYSTVRFGQQRYYHSNKPGIQRSLTRFLIDAPIKPEDGSYYA